jgi:hypothetical protein
MEISSNASRKLKEDKFDDVVGVLFSMSRRTFAGGWWTF